MISIIRKKQKPIKKQIIHQYPGFTDISWISTGNVRVWRNTEKNYVVYINIVHNFNFNSYFFYICSNYFPRENTFTNPSEAIDAIQKYIEDLILSKPLIKRRNCYSQKLRLLDDLTGLSRLSSVNCDFNGKYFFHFLLIIFCNS